MPTSYYFEQLLVEARHRERQLGNTVFHLWNDGVCDIPISTIRLARSLVEAGAACEDRLMEVARKHHMRIKELPPHGPSGMPGPISIAALMKLLASGDLPPGLLQ